MSDAFCFECGTNLKISQQKQISGLLSFVNNKEINSKFISQFTKLNTELENLSDIQALYEQQNHHVNSVRSVHDNLAQDVNRALSNERKEQRLYNKIKGFSFSGLKSRLSGNHRENVENQEINYLNSQSKLQELEEILNTETLKLKQAENELAELQILSTRKDAIENELGRLLETVLEKLNYSGDDHLEDEVLKADNTARNIHQNLSMSHESLNYFRQVLNHLLKAKKELSSAQSLASADLFMSGIWIDIAKNSAQSRARREVQSAKVKLSEAFKFDSSVSQVQIPLINEGSTYEYFFDNIFVDLMSKSRISESERSVSNAISDVKMLVHQKRKEVTNLQQILNEANAKLISKHRLLTKTRIELMKQVIDKRQ